MFSIAKVRLASIVAVASTIVLAATGCGSAQGAASPPGGLDGKPFTVGLVEEESGAYTAPYLRQWGEGVKAAVKMVNEQLGGFGGRPVEINECDSASTTAGALTCANKMVAAKVDVITGISLNFGANGMSAVEAAGIPVQMLPISTQDFTSKLSFPLSPGSAGAYSAIANYATKQLKVKNAVFTAADSGPAQQAVTQLTQYFGAAGGNVVPALVPAASADLSPTVAKIISANPDIIISSLSGVRGISLYQGLHAQGWSAEKVLGGGNLVDVENFLSQVQPPSAVEGSLFELDIRSFDDTANPEVSTYRDAMAKYSAVSGRSNYAMLGFSTVMTDYNLAKSVGFDTFGPAAIIKAYSSQKVPIFMGYEYDRATASADYPAVGNSNVRFVRYRGGKVVYDVDGWVNARTGEVIPD